MQLAVMETAIKQISGLGAQVRRNVPLITYEELRDKAGCEIDDLCSRESSTIRSYILIILLKGHDISQSLRNFFSLFDDPPVKDIQELIKFNKHNAESEFRDGRSHLLSKATTIGLTPYQIIQGNKYWRLLQTTP